MSKERKKYIKLEIMDARDIMIRMGNNLQILGRVICNIAQTEDDYYVAKYAFDIVSIIRHTEEVLCTIANMIIKSIKRGDEE